MLPDPITMPVDDTTAAVAYNTISQSGRVSIRKGSISGTLTGISTHSPQANCQVSHTSTKAGRERSLLRLDISTTHASTGAKESASLNLVIDKDPSGVLTGVLVQVLIAQLTNTLIEGFGGDALDGLAVISSDTVLAQFLNGES